MVVIIVNHRDVELISLTLFQPIKKCYSNNRPSCLNGHLGISD